MSFAEWASPPGHTIEDALEENGLTSDDLRARLDLDRNETKRLLKGTLPLDKALAAELAEFLGSTADFWLRREENYRKALERSRISTDVEALSDTDPSQEKT